MLHEVVLYGICVGLIKYMARVFHGRLSFMFVPCRDHVDLSNSHQWSEVHTLS